MSPHVFSDLALARRLERTEARANASFVEARARIQPETGARWIEVAGTYAMFDGAKSPCTQTFGLGLFSLPTPQQFDTLERFFGDHGAPVMHEVSPLADPLLLPLLSDRGYRPVELTTVLYLPLDERDAMAPSAPRPSALSVRVIDERERALWAQTSRAGWQAQAEFAAFVLELSQVMAARDGAVCFLAEQDGTAVAAGALAIHERVALLAGASTIPEWRRQGAQRALLDERLAYARRAGCDLAVMCASPGSASQRNAEREGFRIAYTRIKWSLPS